MSEEENPISDIMVDIETLGTKYGSVILSVGIIGFQLYNSKFDLKKKQIFLNYKKSTEYGFSIDNSTLKWWHGADRKSVFENLIKNCNSNGIDPKDLPSSIESFINDNKTNSSVRWWAHSPSFDLHLLNAYYEKFGANTPWKHYTSFDTRTLYLIGNGRPINIGNGHDSLSDAENQVNYCHTSISKLLPF